MSESPLLQLLSPNQMSLSILHLLTGHTLLYRVAEPSKTTTKTKIRRLQQLH
nr:MAG TPA: hypothetical protein [Herelleviridae sp.]